MNTCLDCGERMYGGYCVNCDEEHFIADQYRELGESVPLSIAELEGEQIARRTNANWGRITTMPELLRETAKRVGFKP